MTHLLYFLEQELKNQISLELATKNARLYEMKRNLQKQLSERKNEYSIIQKENRELRKQIDDLKKDLVGIGNNKYRSHFYFYYTDNAITTAITTYLI